MKVSRGGSKEGRECVSELSRDSKMDGKLEIIPSKQRYTLGPGVGRRI